MTKKLLRDCLKEAEAKNQEGLIIWPDWRSYEELESELRLDKIDLPAFFRNIQNQKSTVFSVEWNGLILGHVFIASAKEMLSSEEFFKQVLETCEKQHLKGPVVLYPLKTICEAYP